MSILRAAGDSTRRQPYASPSTNHHSLFNSSHAYTPMSEGDLASLYGIPKVLPRAPSTAPRMTTPATPTTPAFPDYDSLRNNYLKMLSQSSSNTVDEYPAPPPPLFMTEDDLINQALESSPLFSDLGDDFSTPLDTPLFDFIDASPFTSPMDEFLTTPLLQDSDEPLISGEYEGMELFGVPVEHTAKPEPSPVNLEGLYSFSPVSPALHSFAAPPAPAPAPPKANPRKRPRPLDEDELGELPPNPTPAEQLAHKRRQNTLAARKSRQRKMDYQKALEDEVDELKRKVQEYKTKTEVYLSVMKNNGMTPPPLPPV